MTFPFLDEKLNWTFHPEIEYAKANYDFTGDYVVDELSFPHLVNKDIELEINYLNI